jgi:nitrite reductase (NO-forming)
MPRLVHSWHGWIITIATTFFVTAGGFYSGGAHAGSLTSGDAIAGRQVFKKCAVCHSLEPGKTLVGPSLAGVVGRKAGSEPDYDYSPAMKQSGLVWDLATLDSYLDDPQKVVPGNKMPFPGLKTDSDRADVSLSSRAVAAIPHRP